MQNLTKKKKNVYNHSINYLYYEITMPQEIIKNWVSSKDNLSNHEQLRVSQQIKAALNNLQSEVTNSITAEKFYEIKDGTVHYHMDLVKQYLRTIKDKEWKDLKAENSSAWIMAVQIGLESLWKEAYDVGRIDGILRSKNQTESNTMKAIKKFQKDHGLTEDGYPGKDTIKALLKALNGEDIINDNWLTNPVEEVVNNPVVEQPIQEQPQIQEQVPEDSERDETKAKKEIEELNNNNQRLHQKKEYLQNLQWPYTNKNNVTIIPQNVDSYKSTVDARYFRKNTILDIPTFIQLAKANNTNINSHLNYLTNNWCTIINGKVTKNGKEIWTIPRDTEIFDEKDYDFNLLWKTLIKDYNEYQTEFWADSAKQQAKLEELLGILGMSLDKSTWKITDKKAQEVGTITLTNQEGVDNISEQEKKLSEAVTTVTENIKKVDKIIDENIAILQDSTKTEEGKMQAIQTIIDHNNFNYVKKITSWLPKEVSWAINNNYRRWIQGSTPAPLQLSLSCGDKHAKLPEIPYKWEQWDKVGKYLIENFTNKNKAKQFKTEEEFKKAQQQCIDMLKKFDISSKSILNGLSFEISNQKGEKIWSLPWRWNNPDTPVITYEEGNENSEFPKITNIFVDDLSDIKEPSPNILEEKIHQRMKSNNISKDIKGVLLSRGDRSEMLFFDQNNNVYNLTLDKQENGSYTMQEFQRENSPQASNIAKLICSSQTKNHEIFDSVKISQKSRELFDKYQLYIHGKRWTSSTTGNSSYDVHFLNPNTNTWDFEYWGLYIYHNQNWEIEFLFNDNINDKIQE